MPRLSMASLKEGLHAAWGRYRFRRHWPQTFVALGLALVWVGQGGCLSGSLLTAGLLVLAVRAVGWLWRRLLFRVSRRLWVILGLLSVLPVLGLTVLLVSLSWLALGAQVSRATQQNLEAWEQAVRTANALPGDAEATLALRTHGQAWISHVKVLPKNVKKNFVGMVWDRSPKGEGEGLNGLDHDTFLLAVRAERDGYRLLRLELGRLGIQSQALLGGSLTYELGTQRAKDAQVRKNLVVRDGVPDEEGPKDAPLATWTQGERPTGSGLFAPFALPPHGIPLVDWASGTPLQLLVKPETSLKALFRGYATREHGDFFSERTAVAIAGVGALLLFILLGQTVATGLGLRMAWSLGGSIDDLHKGVQRLAGGDFSARLRPRSTDQIGALAEAFNTMASQLQASLDERTLRLQLEEELRVAREVQTRLLPDVGSFGFGAQVQATLLPAREVAGDFYDLHRLPDGRLAFLVADVSGKGTSAAFYAAELKGMVAALGETLVDPLEAVDRLNAIWCRSHDRRTFLTLAFGLFDPASGTFAFVRAGHTPAFLRRADGTVTRLQPAGLGIGLTDKGFRARLGLAEGRLAPGDTLLLFTDGLSEAQDAEGNLYGEARLEAALSASPDPVAGLLTDVAAFTGNGPLADDLTMMVLKG